MSLDIMFGATYILVFGLNEHHAHQRGQNHIKWIAEVCLSYWISSLYSYTLIHITTMY